MDGRSGERETPESAAEAPNTELAGVARRSVLKGVAGAGAFGLFGPSAAAIPGTDGNHPSDADPHTLTTFAALVDMVVPRTPNMNGSNEKGALDVRAHEALLTYTNTLFQGGLPGVGHVGNARLSEFVADTLDWAASELVARGMNEHPPSPRARGKEPEPTDRSEDPSRAPAAGSFAKLHREDRVRAIALADQDKNDVDDAGVVPGEAGMFAGDAGLLAQFAVNVTASIYYGESQGYDSGMGEWLLTPPSERTFDPVQDFDGDGAEEAILSWRQTGFPGLRNGHQALRGYLGKEGSALGSGTVWKTIGTDDQGNQIHIYRDDPGSFEETTPDTSGYTEVFQEEAWTLEHRTNGDVTSTDPGEDSELQGYVDRPIEESRIFERLQEQGDRA